MRKQKSQRSFRRSQRYVCELLECRRLLSTVELLSNPSFSSGTSSWVIPSDFWAGTNLSNYRTAPGYAAGGVDTSGTPKNNANGSMYQQFAVPTGASVTFSWYYFITTQETTTTQKFDKMQVDVVNTSGQVITNLANYSNLDKASGYQQSSLFNTSSLAGQTVRLRFLATTDGSNTTVFRIDDVSATANIPNPTVTTTAATNVGTTTATMNGSVNPNGALTSVWFEYGLTTSYTSSTNPVSAGSGTNTTSFASNLSGLTQDTTYHYRFAAANTDTPPYFYGNDATFTTHLPAPTLSTPLNGASGVSNSPNFAWSQVSGNHGYRIICSTNQADLPTDADSTGGTPANGFNADITTSNQTSYAVTTPLSTGTTYFWEVHAKGGTAGGFWSGIYSFTTGTPQPAPSKGLIFQTAVTETAVDNSGPVIMSPNVALVFWGTGWTNNPAPSITAVHDAAQAILTGPFLRPLGNYRAGMTTGSIYASYTISSTSPPSNFTNNDVQSMLVANINNGTLPRPTIAPDLLYMVFTQTGSSDPAEGASGEHFVSQDNQSNKFHYGWTINDGNLDTISKVYSHELVEAMTDPEINAIQVPINNTNAEIADNTAQGFRARLNGYMVQSYWLQSRQVFLVPTGTQDLTLNGTTLTINGDQLANKDDSITISSDNFGGVTVGFNGESVALLAGSVDTIQIRTQSGNDTINVNSLPVGVTADIDTGSGNDTVNVTGALPGRTFLIEGSPPGPGNVANVVGLAGVESLTLTTGTFSVAADLGPIGLTLASGTTTTFLTVQHLANLTIAGGSVNLPAGRTNTLSTNSLSIINGGSLDLSDNALILTQDAPATLTNVSAYLTGGRNGSPGAPGLWNGPGIQSSYANQFGNGFNLAIGYADNTDLAAVRASGSYTTFAGQTVASNYVLVQLTRGADATLDGVVDGQDVATIGTHFQKPGSGQWCFGDFDYSGTCDGSDVAVLGTTFGKTSPVLSPAHFSTPFNSLTPNAAPTGASTSISTSASSISITNTPIPVNDSTSKSRFSTVPIVNRSTGETDAPLYKTKRRGLASRPQLDVLSRQA